MVFMHTSSATIWFRTPCRLTAAQTFSTGTGNVYGVLRVKLMCELRAMIIKKKIHSNDGLPVGIWTTRCPPQANALFPMKCISSAITNAYTRYDLYIWILNSFESFFSFSRKCSAYFRFGHTNETDRCIVDVYTFSLIFFSSLILSTEIVLNHRNGMHLHAHLSMKVMKTNHKSVDECRMCRNGQIYSFLHSRLWFVFMWFGISHRAAKLENE